jgi:RNA polymerase sigma-70 factor, ECF subfamily
MLQNQLWTANLSPGPQYMDDTILVAGLQRGDTRAIEYVVQQYAPALYRYAYYQLQDAMLAEDVVSEVMARMVGRVDKYVLESTPFQAWLFRIARNLIADHYRARKRRPQVSLETWLEIDPSQEPGGLDTQILDLPDREELMAGLALLTEEQRQVILLHVVEGWELPQVAKLLDRSVPSVKSLYYRGVQSLRRVLARSADPQGQLPA